MTYPSGPLQPLPLDGPGQRRRRLATGGGILAVAGIVVAGMALTQRPARHPLTAEQVVGAAPSSAPGATGPSAIPSSAPPSTPAPSERPGTSAPPAPTAGSADIDGDGRPDVASVQFAGKRSAELVVRLGSGKTLTSKAFPLYRQDGAGTVTPFDVNGDGRSEVLVDDPGADGTGYELFTYVTGALVEVAAPKGQQQPFLYDGGGMYYQSSFGCTGHQLVIAREQPVVRSTASMPPDPQFTVTTTSYTLAGGTLTAATTHTETVADRAAAEAALARTANACGARP